MPEAVNLERLLFRDEFGLEYPMRDIFDEFGAPCDPEEAVAAVAGHEGRWFAINLSDFK